MDWFFNLEPEQQWGLTLILFPAYWITRAFVLAIRDEFREQDSRLRHRSKFR